AEYQIQGLRQALRRYFRGGERRFLCNRPDVVQPGDGDCYRAQERRKLRVRPHRHRYPRPLLLVMTSDIILFGDGKDWHGRSLARAFKKRGLKTLTAPLATCGFSTETRTGLAIPGLGDHRPRGAFVRFVPGGTFEE